MAKLVIKETQETKANGTAGKVIQSVVGRNTVGETVILSVMVSNGLGGLLGPYAVRQSDTEVKQGVLSL